MTERVPLHPDEALSIVQALPVATPREETVLLTEALDRALPRSVPAPMDSPPFDKAAMDGFAVRADDESERFRIVETIAAGDTPGGAAVPGGAGSTGPVGSTGATGGLQAGECARIMTGARVPVGTGKVVRVEFTEVNEGWMRLTQPEPLGNVIRRGENARAGSDLLTPRVLGPADIAVLAAMGIPSVSVAARPMVGIVATGSELRLPGEPLSDGQIYNSNSFSLCAQARRAGALTTDYGIVRDDRAVMTQTIARALAESDVLLLSGGVSIGDYDYVPEVLAECGVTVRFHKLRIKPGKPTLFGTTDRGFVFGLPGNPASTYVLFELFVAPLIQRLMGLTHQPIVHRGELAVELSRRIADRVEYLPARIADGVVEPCAYRGSNHINGVADANCLIRMELDQTHIAQGSVVHVRQI